MRLPHPGQPFVAPDGAPPKSQWRSSHASPQSRTAPRGPIWSSTEDHSCTRMRLPQSRTAFRCPTGSSTESPSAAVRMPLHPPRTAFRGPIGSSTEGNSCCTHMRPPLPRTAFRGPQGSPPIAILTTTVLTTAYVWVLRQAN
eukprot:2321036-Pyramimonas_sp.AAC.1